MGELEKVYWSGNGFVLRSVTVWVRAGKAVSLSMSSKGETIVPVEMALSTWMSPPPCRRTVSNVVALRLGGSRLAVVVSSARTSAAVRLSALRCDRTRAAAPAVKDWMSAKLEKRGETQAHRQKA